MEGLITSPERFAAHFNQTVPGAYRKITAHDIRDMATCNLIGKYGYFLRDDVETIRAMLQYEQLRQNRRKKDEIRDSDGTLHCRRCGVVIADKQGGKRGRPKEYCTDCEPFRVRERYKKWTNRQVKVLRGD